MSFANKFGSFKASVDEGADAAGQPVAAPKKQEKPMGHGREKKVVIKAKPVQSVAEGGYEIGGQQQHEGDGERRGGRGGRGGGRGGDRPRTAGGRGEDRVEGEGRRGGDRRGGGRGRGESRGGDRPEGGRGRGRGDRQEGDGDRPARGRGGSRGGDRGGRGGDRGGRGGARFDRTTQAQVAGDEMGPDRQGRGADREQHGYQGKAREEYHPMDRKSGTGRGRRDDRKGGNRTDKGEKSLETPAGEQPAVEGEESKKEEKAEGEEAKKEEKPEEVAAEEVKEEEEEDPEALEGMDYADWEAKQALARESGVLKKAEVRAHVENPDARVIENTEEKVRISGIQSNVAGREMHATKAGTNSHLLGFAVGGGDEDEGFQERRGGDRPRGGRGRGGSGRGGDRGDRGAGRGAGGPSRGADRPRQGGARKGGRIVSNESDFPTL